MVRGGGSRRAGSPRRTPARPTPRPTTRTARPAAPIEEPRSLVLGAVPGATPGRWIGVWRERMPHVALELRAIAAATQRAEVVSGAVDTALVRLPLADDALHVIPLYEEVTVAVVPSDSHLTAAEELDLADLAGEVVLTPGDDVLGAVAPGALAPDFEVPDDTAEAIAIVASGVGVVLVPMSLARLHARKDVAHRPVRDAPVSRVGLAWRRDGQTPDVDAFIGVVRGRTANSSR